MSINRISEYMTTAMLSFWSGKHCMWTHIFVCNRATFHIYAKTFSKSINGCIVKWVQLVSKSWIPLHLKWFNSIFPDCVFLAIEHTLNSRKTYLYQHFIRQSSLIHDFQPISRRIWFYSHNIPFVIVIQISWKRPILEIYDVILLPNYHSTCEFL